MVFLYRGIDPESGRLVCLTPVHCDLTAARPYPGLSPDEAERSAGQFVRKEQFLFPDLDPSAAAVLRVPSPRVSMAQPLAPVGSPLAP